VLWPARSFSTAPGLDPGLVPDLVLPLIIVEIAPIHMIAEAHLQEVVAKTVTSEARVSPTTHETVLLLWESARQSKTETGAEIVVMSSMKRSGFTDVVEVIETEEDLMTGMMEAPDVPVAVIMWAVEVIHMAIHATQNLSPAMSVPEAAEEVDAALHDRRMARKTNELQRAKMEVIRTAAWVPLQEMRSASRR